MSSGARRGRAGGPIPRHTRYQGAIIRDHHILLITHHEHRSGRFYWVVPGGGIEPPETEEECVIREMLEETHLSVKVDRLLLDEPARSRGIYQRYKTYLCSVEAGVAEPGSEPEPDVAARYSITDVGWFDLRDPDSWDEKLQADRITRPQVESIRKALGYG